MGKYTMKLRENITNWIDRSNPLVEWNQNFVTNCVGFVVDLRCLLVSTWSTSNPTGDKFEERYVCVFKWILVSMHAIYLRASAYTILRCNRFVSFPPACPAWISTHKIIRIVLWWFPRIGCNIVITSADLGFVDEKTNHYDPCKSQITENLLNNYLCVCYSFINGDDDFMENRMSSKPFDVSFCWIFNAN